MAIKVMLADDHQVFLQGLAVLLQSAGIELNGTANDRDLLLQMIVADPPNVAIVDLGMPGIGIALLLSELRERRVPTSVLILTGSDDESVGELMAYGARGFMHKEHAFEDLQKAILCIAN